MAWSRVATLAVVYLCLLCSAWGQTAPAAVGGLAPALQMAVDAEAGLLVLVGATLFNNSYTLFSAPRTGGLAMALGPWSCSPTFPNYNVPLAPATLALDTEQQVAYGLCNGYLLAAIYNGSATAVRTVLLSSVFVTPTFAAIDPNTGYLVVLTPTVVAQVNPKTGLVLTAFASAGLMGNTVFADWNARQLVSVNAASSNRPMGVFYQNGTLANTGWWSSLPLSSVSSYGSTAAVVYDPATNFLVFVSQSSAGIVSAMSTQSPYAIVQLSFAFPLVTCYGTTTPLAAMDTAARQVILLQPSTASCLWNMLSFAAYASVPRHI